jgi:hypothetical protein
VLWLEKELTMLQLANCVSIPLYLIINSLLRKPKTRIDLSQFELMKYNTSQLFRWSINRRVNKHCIWWILNLPSHEIWSPSCWFHSVVCAKWCYVSSKHQHRSNNTCCDHKPAATIEEQTTNGCILAFLSGTITIHPHKHLQQVWVPQMF